MRRSLPLPVAPELNQLSPALALWSAYDPRSKAELFSTAIKTPAGLVIIDPIPVAEPALEDLAAAAPKVAGIFVTNANHWRAASFFAQRFSVPVFAHEGAKDDADGMPDFLTVVEGESIFQSLSVVALNGGAPGESALFAVIDGSRTLVVGDALIHFAPYGFALLPEKYCTNQKELRRSLGRAARLAPERILFAHGLPLQTDASEKLKALCA